MHSQFDSMANANRPNYTRQRLLFTIETVHPVMVRFNGELMYLARLAHYLWEEGDGSNRHTSYIATMYRDGHRNMANQAADVHFCELISASPQDIEIRKVFNEIKWHPPETLPSEGSAFVRILAFGKYRTIHVLSATEGELQLRYWDYHDYETQRTVNPKAADDFKIISWSKY